ncbi:MAG: TIR domain-containing protein, partial [Bacteroidota bacterium]
FQSSAQLIANCMKELFDKVKASPDLIASEGSGGSPGAASQPAATVTSTQVAAGTRVVKPPPKAASAQAPSAPPIPGQAKGAAPPSGGGKKVYVVGEKNNVLCQQLSMFLGEIGLEEISLNRTHGKMLELDSIQHEPDIRFAFFVFNSDDLAYAMFEVGHFVGKLGKGRVCVLHMSDVEFPKNVPGVIGKSIVVKLEEASLSILRELKAAGYQISL